MVPAPVPQRCSCVEGAMKRLCSFRVNRCFGIPYSPSDRLANIFLAKRCFSISLRKSYCSPYSAAYCSCECNFRATKSWNLIRVPSIGSENRCEPSGTLRAPLRFTKCSLVEGQMKKCCSFLANLCFGILCSPSDHQHVSWTSHIFGSSLQKAYCFPYSSSCCRRKCKT